MSICQCLRHLRLLGLLALATPLALARAAEQPGPSAALLAAPFYSCVRNFYVAATGSDANPGTQASPWQTIQHADSAARTGGDCINVAAGTYQANVLLTHGGTAPTAIGYVAYRCQTLDGCHILAPGTGHLWGIRQPANFVVVDGFELDGNNALKPDGIADACLSSDGDTYGTGNSSHHIWALNNIVHHCTLAGIALSNKEWYYVLHNTIFHNAWSSGYQGSGIDFVVVQCVESGNAACASGETYEGGTGTYTPSGMDLAPFDATKGVYTPFHNVVAWNNVYDNRLAPGNPAGCGKHTDGNGIIMDTFLDETAHAIVYPYRSLVMGNLAYGNGGRGIHVFRASNITVANNTVYGNGTDGCMPGTALGDLSQQGGANNVWISNIAQSVMLAKSPAGGGANAPLVAGDGAGIADMNNIYANNVTYGGLGVRLFDNDAKIFAPANNKTNADPMLVAPSAGNFALRPSSPAIGNGQALDYLSTFGGDAGACPSTLAACPSVAK
jgi:parallel beta-helix repeat protein